VISVEFMNATEVHQDVAREIGDRVYFLSAPSVGMIKIGTSFQPGRRFAEVALMSPVSLEFIGSVAGGSSVETEWHRRWAHLRTHGEWFSLTPELADEITLASMADRWNRLSPAGRDQFRRAAMARVER